MGKTICCNPDCQSRIEYSYEDVIALLSLPMKFVVRCPVCNWQIAVSKKISYRAQPITKQELYAANLKKYSVNRQWDKLIEEMAELTRAIQKLRYKPNEDNNHNLYEEFSDVEIVLGQCRLLLDDIKLGRITEKHLRKLQDLDPATNP